MRADVPYKNLTHTLLSLKIQAEDSLPYISNYIPDTITSPEKLFYFLKDLTTYKSDPKGVELLQTVQTLMDRGGKGDCDCFTILTLAACHYLGFEPQQVALVGKTKYSPSHIYSLVYDKSKKKMCSMDLTNPYYDTERPYKFKQTLPFMMTLRLEDNFFASKASRKAKKEARKTKKVVRQAAKTATKTARVAARTAKKETKAKRKVVRAAAKTKRITSRQNRRTDRTEKKEQRKGLKRAVKVARQEKRLMRVHGKQDIIKARQAQQMYNIENPQHEEASDYEFDPGSDQIPETDYQASGEEVYDEFELMPEEEEEYYEEEYPEEEYYEEEELNEGLSFFPGALTLINKVGGKIKKAVAKAKGSQVGRSAQSGASKYNEIMALKADNSRLKIELENETKNKYIYGGVGSVSGVLAGILIGRATK